MAKFILLQDAKNEQTAVKGTVVYSCKFHDYGCASDDTRFTGVQHVSVTLNEDGNYPFFTCPFADLEPVKD